MSKHTAILACVMIIFCLLTSCGDDNKEKAAKYIDSARQLVAHQKPETAIIEYRNALELDPDSDVALFELAETYILMNKVDSAIRYYILAAQTNPERIEPLLRLAQVYTRTDRLLEARSRISKAMEIDPDSVNARHLLSGVQIRERDFGAAIATLKQAEEIAPENIQTLLALAQLYVKTNQADAAVDTYQKAISLDSSSRDAYMGLVRLYGARNQGEKIEDLLVSVSQTPGIPAVKFNDLARFYQTRENLEKAETYFKKAVDAAPDEIFPAISLAGFYTKAGFRDKAVSTLESALERFRENTGLKIMVLTGLSRVHLHFNDVDGATAAIENALGIRSNNADALFQKGRVLMAQGDFKQALDVFDQVLGLNRFHARAFYYRAICIQERGASDRPEQRIFRAAAGMLDNPEAFEKDQIRENLIAALTIDPTLVEARRSLATQYLLEERADKAREQVEEILKQGPPDYLTMNIVAGINMLEGEPDKAEEILNTIVRENPAYVPAYIRLGFFYKQRNDPAKAVSFFEKAYEKDRSAIGLVDEIIGILVTGKAYSEALDVIEKYGRDAEPDDLPFFNNLRGEVLLAEGRRKEAMPWFEKAVALAPGFIRPRMRLARYWGRSGQPDKALEQYMAIETVNPGHLPALIGIGLILDAKQDTAGAEAYYRKALALAPRNALIANNLAFLLSEKKGGLEEAFHLAQTARTLAPNSPDVLDTLGWIYYQKGSYFNALSEFEEGLKLAPDNAILQYHYGMALYMTKAYEKARVHLKKALALDPGFKGSEAARKILN
ncbi:MAG: tetratricopeptide repeat protein [Desulfobacter sp.]